MRGTHMCACMPHALHACIACQGSGDELASLEPRAPPPHPAANDADDNDDDDDEEVDDRVDGGGGGGGDDDVDDDDDDNDLGRAEESTASVGGDAWLYLDAGGSYTHTRARPTPTHTR